MGEKGTDVREKKKLMEKKKTKQNNPQQHIFVKTVSNLLDRCNDLQIFLRALLRGRNGERASLQVGL